MELPESMAPFEYAEVRFKNSRKEFYRVGDVLGLNVGDAVIVEGNPGYDVGLVSASGELARLQMDKKKNITTTKDARKILRKANSQELQLWREARSLEDSTMQLARKIASGLKLEMKISDVEYQGDKTKAIFYYTAEGRVDFRELIRRYAETFRVRIEMKQIGARQEAARLGGIGSCGRELCCSTWLTDFRSVSTSAARYQQLALNAAKLAGQCGKLKCCLNYELDAYVDALKQFPKNHGKLKTEKGTAFHLKTDIFKGLIWYMYEDSPLNSPIPVSAERVKEILALNEKGQMPKDLKDFAEDRTPIITEPEAYGNVVGQDSLSRFDQAKRKKKGKKKPGKGGGAVATAEKPKQGAPQKQDGKPRNNRNRNRKPGNKPQ
jgi:cell fate regulator YaaT (PSP1 superfamily)